MELKDCIPHDKSDTLAIFNAKAVGFPVLNPILPDLLVWLQDVNWPVAEEMANILSKAGPEIISHISDILHSDDPEWKDGLLTLLAPHLKPEIWTGIRRDVRRLARRPTAFDKENGIDAVALNLLACREA